MKLIESRRFYKVRRGNKFHIPICEETLLYSFCVMGSFNVSIGQDEANEKEICKNCLREYKAYYNMYRGNSNDE